MISFVLYAFGCILLLILVPAIPVALLLRARDRRMEREGKTPAQIQAASELAGMFHRVAERCIPGALVSIGGIAFANHFYSEHDGNWWWGLVVLFVGLLLVRLLAYRLWQEYLRVRHFVNTGQYEYE